MRHKMYIDIGDGYNEFYPDKIEPFRRGGDASGITRYIFRYSWGKLSVSNDTQMYESTGDDVYRLYDIVNSYKPTFEVKVKLVSDSLEIEGYFGINDCEFDDDKKIFDVKPTILDIYTPLFENWETKIDFSGVDFDALPTELNVKEVGLKPIDDWTVVEYYFLTNRRGRGRGGVVAGYAPMVKIPVNTYVVMNYLSGFFDGNAPKRQLFAVPPTKFQDQEGFYLADREQILGEDFSDIDLSGDEYVWLSTKTYGIAIIEKSLDNIVWYRSVPTNPFKAYKSIKFGNLNKQPDINPEWWEEFDKGEIFPSKGDYELSELTVWDGGIIYSGGLKEQLYCTTKFSREEFRKIDVVSESDPSGYEPPQGEGWHLRSKVKVGGQNGHLWTRKPFNGAFSDNWSLQDEEENTDGQSDHFEWWRKRTTRINYDKNISTGDCTTTITSRGFLEYALRNTSSVFEGKNVYSTFFFNDFEDELPILEDRIGQGYNYVTLAKNYLNNTSFILTRDLIPDIDLSDKSTFPDISLKEIIEDFNNLFAGNLYCFLDDDFNLRIEHVKYIDLTKTVTDLRGREELSETLVWKYDKSLMFNKVELRQVNAKGRDFTENLIVFDKIVSNKRTKDIKQEFETSIFSTDIRYAIENSGDLEDGVFFLATEPNNILVENPQIDEIEVSGSTGSAGVTAGGLTRTINASYLGAVFSVISFISAYSDDYSSIGISLTRNLDKLIFTKNGRFQNASILNISGNMNGVASQVRAYSVTGTSTKQTVRSKIGFLSGVEEANGFLALSNIINDFGRYEGVWEKGIVNGIEKDFTTTSRTKKGDEILLKGISTSLFYITDIGIGIVDDETIDFEEENTKLNISYRYDSNPYSDRFVLVAQKENDFIGAENIWLDIASYTTWQIIQHERNNNTTKDTT